MHAIEKNFFLYSLNINLYRVHTADNDLLLMIFCYYYFLIINYKQCILYLLLYRYQYLIKRGLGNLYM
jgi:hypothetical protein